MVCRFCGFANVEGRKYCRGCAQALAGLPSGSAIAAKAPPGAATPALPAAKLPGPVSPDGSLANGPAPGVALRVAALSSPAPRPALNKMALVSLTLSIFAFIVPVGVAAIVLGYVSRGQIARSVGRQRGMGIASAALVTGYLQVALIVLLALGMIGASREFHTNLDTQPRFRAALLEWLTHGNPGKVTPERTARHQASTLAALRMIREKQKNYLAAHLGEGYTCQFDQLGLDVAERDWRSLLMNSDYDIKILRCPLINGPNYVVLAIPRSSGNPADAPTYCLDQVNGIERYDTGQARDSIPKAVTRVTEPCPLTGAHVD
jgi:hypothetical protein